MSHNNDQYQKDQSDETENDLDVLDGQDPTMQEEVINPGAHVAGQEVMEAHIGVRVPVEVTPLTLLSQAMDSGLSPDTLKQFMDLAERHDADEARKAFAADMAKCQKDMQPIVATAENEHTSSYYAKLGHINKAITPVYGKHGFSISFGQGTPAVEGDIRTTARLLHRKGHFEDFHVDFPLDDVGSAGNTNKTAIHARQSSNTYGKRNIVMGIFNLSILSEDDDGNAAGGTAGFVSSEEAVTIQSMIDGAGLVNSALLREMGVTEWPLLPAKKLDKTMKRLNQLIEQRA